MADSTDFSIDSILSGIQKTADTAAAVYLKKQETAAASSQVDLQRAMAARDAAALAKKPGMSASQEYMVIGAVALVGIVVLVLVLK